ncbi:uncharacterized protein LOC143854808 [Tasmannia lanceolata]|uniref:uncharacterized protein LOC143854808 n=1 Tax=Tasmannia lanceolata TaxID=3420 RepID=UPI004063583B
MGGPAAGGTSTAARKAYARRVNAVHTSSKKTKTENEISFSDADLDNLILPHDDALVLTMLVANWEVKKILIDNGSSTDILDELRGTQPAEDLISIPLCSEDNGKVALIGSSLSSSIQRHLTEFLQNNADVFAWAPIDMPGIDPEVSMHRLGVDTTCKPVKQKRMHFAFERRQAIKEEVERLLKADFIRYPLLKIDQLIDATTGHELLSFMDAFSGYNQIRMYESDIPKTSFVTDQGTYCYHVMPFSLKNAGATYQRLVNRLFQNQIGRPEKAQHEAKPHQMHLRRQLRNVLGVYVKGLKTAPWTVECQTAFEELKQYLSSPPLLTKPESGEELLLYLSVSPTALTAVLVHEEHRQQKPIYYVSKVLHDAEIRYQRVEKLAYALVMAARKLRPYFQAHTIKVLTDQSLRQVLHRPDISGRLVKWAVELSEFDIQYVPRPAIKAQVLADFVAECTIPQQTAESEVVQTPVVAEKSITTEECTARETEAEVIPSPAEQDLSTAEPLWEVYVDGSSNKGGCGAGLILTGPDSFTADYALRFGFRASNNEAEYEALLAGMNLAVQVKAQRLRAYCDSQLVANQIQGVYEANTWLSISPRSADWPASSKVLRSSEFPEQRMQRQMFCLN